MFYIFIFATNELCSKSSFLANQTALKYKYCPIKTNV